MVQMQRSQCSKSNQNVGCLFCRSCVLTKHSKAMQKMILQTKNQLKVKICLIKVAQWHKKRIWVCLIRHSKWESLVFWLWAVCTAPMDSGYKKSCSWWWRVIGCPLVPPNKSLDNIYNRKKRCTKILGLISFLLLQIWLVQSSSKQKR